MVGPWWTYQKSGTESESFEKRAQIFFVLSDDCHSKQEKTFALQSPSRVQQFVGQR